MPETPNRGPWIIAAAILLAAGLVVGFLVYQDRQDQRCQEWQALVRDVAEATDLPTYQLAPLFDGDEEDPRPSGCPNP